MEPKLYRVLANFRNLNQPTYRGEPEDFNSAVERAADLSVTRWDEYRSIYIECCRDHVIVMSKTSQYFSTK